MGPDYSKSADQITIFNRLARSILPKSLFSAPLIPPQQLQFEETENEFLVSATSLTTSDFDRDLYPRATPPNPVC